ncbi:MAG TPA: HDOD domain-containing protein [Candidatus Saccharimonadales bacterium]|nr:HDOD domain-containing protein [Candidatus Saccharimonadales bacterium]
MQNKPGPEFIQRIQRSLSDLERAQRQFESLARAAQAQAAATSVQHSLQSVLEAAVDGTGMRIGSLATRTGPNGPIEVEHRRELDDGLLDHARAELEEQHFVWVLERGRALLLSPPGVPVDISDVRAVHFYPGNFLLVPLPGGHDQAGLLCVGTLERRHRFQPDDLRFLQILATMARSTLRSIRAVEEAQTFLIATIRSLSAALDARDPYTRGHSERVAMYSLAILNELEAMRGQGFADGFRDSVRLGAMLHDIGKIGISDSILHKPERLNEEEFEAMKSHAEKGAAIVNGVKNIRDILDAIRFHHERFDGTGYPKRLKGEVIPLIARIVGTADCFDAITSDRPYRHGSAPEFAVEQIRNLAGLHHDPEVVEALGRAFESGALSVQLEADRSEPASENQELLERLFSQKIKELPSMPQVVHTVIERSRDPNCSIRELAELVSRDQGLVSRLLRLVNSAFYGFSRRISTVSLALTILGLRNVRNMVINVGLAGFFRGGNPQSRATRLRLWEHSVETAVGAMTLARLRRMGEPDEAFTAGLLHDIGRIALDYYHHDLSARIESLIEEEGLSELEAEERVTGVHHGAIGAWVAAQWNLPGSLCDAIRFHHDPARCATESPGSLQLTYIAGAAEALSELRHRVDDNQENHLLSTAVQHLALTREEIQATLEAMEREKSAMLQVLGPEFELRKAA